MGSLKPAFILCPFSDKRNNFLGMANDKEMDRVILTINKNMAIRYNFIDQSQEISWTSTKFEFSDKVVYCQEIDNYGAIIHNTKIGLWNESDTALKKVFRCSFSSPIRTMLTSRSMDTLVVFKNGFVVTLRKASGHKDCPINTDDGPIDPKLYDILDCYADEISKHVIIVSSAAGKDSRTARHHKLREAIMVTIINFTNEKLKIVDPGTNIRPESPICGSCFLPNGRNSAFVYVCSDGAIFERKIFKESSFTMKGRIDDHCSLKTPVVMKCSKETPALIIYGSDPHEEGAVVFLYDLKYNLLVSRQHLKMFEDPPIMGVISENILIPVGAFVLVIRFTPGKSLLSSVISKPRRRNLKKDSNDGALPTKPFESVVLSEWGATDKLPNHPLKPGTSLEVAREYKELTDQGLTDYRICNILVPKIVAKKDFDSVHWLMTSDCCIPESSLLKILLLIVDKCDVFLQFDDHENLNDSFASFLQCNISEDAMVKELKAMEYEDVHKIFTYFAQSLQGIADKYNYEDYGTILSKIMKWMQIIVDAQYHNFIVNNELEMVESALEDVYTLEKTILNNEEASLKLQKFLVDELKEYAVVPDTSLMWYSEHLTLVDDMTARRLHLHHPENPDILYTTRS